MAIAKQKIMPCLWFNKMAEEAANFYAATFPDSRITSIHKAPADYPSGKAGDVLTTRLSDGWVESEVKGVTAAKKPRARKKQP